MTAQPRQLSPLASTLPKWEQFERKDVRLREDQLVALTAQTRRLRRARRVRNREPITDNTLIRIAVDLLISVADDLRGDTEDELRGSLLGGISDP